MALAMIVAAWRRLILVMAVPPREFVVVLAQIYVPTDRSVNRTKSATIARYGAWCYQHND